ncbi:GxxExxY protein [Phenylobacterium sp.]|uniref:GxxExxY protein n=1 Tax=Phenylobacterium sp. TaxID=1871053 RepID=UPI0019AF98F3|nr:GxxExxY protein [Phenylobacterium sp.]MBC7167824.1 GxxExxY protein [Phenylobacterium sp.]
MDEAADRIAREVVDAGLKVHRALGPGLLEAAYEHCLAYELEGRGLLVERQLPLSIVYEGLRLEGAYRLDLLVGRSVIVEVKAVEALSRLHEAQLLTYMRLSGHRLGLLVNFNVELLKHGLRRLIL